MEDESDDDIVCVAATLIAVAVKNKTIRKRKPRSCWIRDWLSRRASLGAHAALLQNIRVSDPSTYRNFCRLSPEDYDELLEMVRPAITHQDTRLRKAISADERLALTLRFLATGLLHYYDTTCFAYGPTPHLNFA